MKRFLVLSLFAALAGLAIAPTASAQKPVIEPLPPSEPVVLEDVCAFPVLLEEVVNRAKTITFPDGRTIYSGALKVRLTNLDEPSNSLVLNISGPGVETPTEGGGFILTATGPWLWFFSPGELGPGEPGALFLTKGRAQLIGEPDGDLTFRLLSGRRTNLCPALA